MSPPVSFQSRVVGVTHPVQSLSDVRRADARSAQIGGPSGVARSFQVSAYKVEPSEAVLACNLLAKDDWRAALFDEVVEGWPEVPLVSKPSAFACIGERLTRAATCPHSSGVSPASKAESSGPDTDAREKMTLGELSQLNRMDVFDAAGVDDTVCDVTLGDKVAQPLCCVRVNLVVVSGHDMATFKKAPRVRVVKSPNRTRCPRATTLTRSGTVLVWQGLL
jgi:hypothetical protein